MIDCTENIRFAEQFLKPTDIIDWQHHDVLNKARELAGKHNEQDIITKRCFEWVRDEIRHSADYHRPEVTCRASDVLQARTGLCYAKSHLLAALLRANSIPAGLCYQRLENDDERCPFCLHGLVAVFLKDYGWYRIDPRGNKQGVNAQFTPPKEQLAFEVSIDGEADLPEIWPDPLPLVVSALTIYDPLEKLLPNLPDVEILRSPTP